MNANPASASHPAPARHKVKPTALYYGLCAAPIAWAIQSVTGYALASYSCYPAAVPRATPLLAHVWPVMLALNVVALAISLSSSVVAWRSWIATRHEQCGTTSSLMDVGEGRTRFLAMCGMILGGGFVAATLFTSVALLLTPLCR